MLVSTRKPFLDKILFTPILILSVGEKHKVLLQFFIKLYTYSCCSYYNLFEICKCLKYWSRSLDHYTGHFYFSHKMPYYDYYFCFLCFLGTNKFNEIKTSFVTCAMPQLNLLVKIAWPLYWPFLFQSLGC